MTTWLAVGAFGAVGAILRALAGHRLPALAGTALVNLCAAFLLGLTSTWEGVSGTAVRVGLLGALSTWSTLAHELAELDRTGQRGRAVAYLAFTLVAGVGVAWIGLILA